MRPEIILLLIYILNCSFPSLFVLETISYINKYNLN